MSSPTLPQPDGKLPLPPLNPFEDPDESQCSPAVTEAAQLAVTRWLTGAPYGEPPPVPTETEIALFGLALREAAWRERRHRFQETTDAAAMIWLEEARIAHELGLPEPEPPDRPAAPNWDAAWSFMQRMIYQGLDADRHKETPTDADA